MGSDDSFQAKSVFIRITLDFPEMIMTALTGTSSAGRTIAKWKWDVLQEGQDMLLPNRLHLIRRLMARTGPNSENKNQRPIILKLGAQCGREFPDIILLLDTDVHVKDMARH